MYIKALLKLDSTTIKPSCYSSEIDQLYLSSYITQTIMHSILSIYQFTIYLLKKYMFPVKSFHDSDPSYFGLATIPVQPSP